MKKWKCWITVLVVIVAMTTPIMADTPSFDANSYAITIPAIDVNGQCYEVVLNYYTNPSDQNLYWIVDVNSLGTVLGCGGDSATLDLGNLDILIPFLEYQGAFYELTLNYAGDISGGGNFIWRLDISSVGLVSNQGMDITLEANPNNVLSVFVSWTTQQPMDSEVQFGEGDYEFRIHDDNEVTDHEVLVIGMHAETEYLIKAVSSNSSGTLRAESIWTTGSLPVQIPNGTILTRDAAKSQPGWTLINVLTGNGATIGDSYPIPNSDYPAAAVMYDHVGLPVWYYIHGDSPDNGGCTSTEFLNDNGKFSVLIGPTESGEPPREVDLAGNIIWEGLKQPPVDALGRVGNLSHHVAKLSNNNYLLLYWMRDESSFFNPKATDAKLEVVTAANEVEWEWNLYSIITPGGSGDWCHANWATIDFDNDAVYLSCRWTGFYKTTYSDPKSLEWHMPAIYNETTTGDVAFIPPESQFYDIHEPEFHDDGTIMFFDNDGWDYSEGDRPGGYHSRVLEFQVDEVTKEATLVWEFPGNFDVDPWFTEDFYCPFWGDANRLENNNVLVAAGRVGVGIISHVFEVTNDGEVVWDFILPDDHGIYRAHRITPPLVEPI